MSTPSKRVILPFLDDNAGGGMDSPRVWCLIRFDISATKVWNSFHHEEHISV